MANNDLEGDTIYGTCYLPGNEKQVDETLYVMDSMLENEQLRRSAIRSYKIMMFAASDKLEEVLGDNV